MADRVCGWELGSEAAIWMILVILKFCNELDVASCGIQGVESVEMASISFTTALKLGDYISRGVEGRSFDARGGISDSTNVTLLEN
jgi:hypothetical protein